MPENPYKSPLSEPAIDTKRESRFKWIVLPAIAGGFLGQVFLADYVRGPGDPFGKSISFGLGGLIGLGFGLASRLLWRVKEATK